MIEGLQSEQMKVYIEFISPTDRRPKFIYEANADTEDTQECLKTIYVYDGTSTQILYAVEQQSTWQEAWDDAAEVAAQATIPPYTTKA